MTFLSSFVNLFVGLRPLHVLCLLMLTGVVAAQTDRFGGNPVIQRDATGFFRVEQVNGRWMFITPEGHGYLALGANHIGKFMDAQAAELLQRFDGDESKAGEAYAPFWPRLQTQMPWVANISYPQGSANFQFDVFDPKWQARLHAHVLRECQAIADNPFVIGVAFADQPEWGKKRLEYFRSLPDGAPGKKRLQEYQGNEEDFLGVIADAHYTQLKAAVRAGAPKHLFLGERFVLRNAPDPVLKAVGKHVDIFCTQALILSRHRPPEWQVFQKDGWDHEAKLTGKPILVIDWAAPFSLAQAFDSEHGRIKSEAEAAEDSASWITAALAHPGIVGVFRCQVIGTHGNDRWFEGKAKRTYLRDDGTPFPIMAARMSAANRGALLNDYEKIVSEAEPVPVNIPGGHESLANLACKVRPGFLLGSMASGLDFTREDNPPLQDFFCRNFNLMTVGVYVQGMQRQPGEFDFKKTDALIRFAEANDLKVHLHPLIGGAGYTSRWVNQGSLSADALQRVMCDRITTILTRYKGRVHYVDVVNEALSGQGRKADRQFDWQEKTHLGEEHVWLKTLGMYQGKKHPFPRYLVEAFRIARQAGGPDLKLILNEWGNETTHSSRGLAFLELIEAMREEGIPVDGAGLQLHCRLKDGVLRGWVSDQPFDFDAFDRMLRLYEEAGMEVHITEFDIHLPPSPTRQDYELQGKYYAEILRHAVPSPAVKTFTTWGFTDRHSWRSNGVDGHPLMLDENLRPKPAYLRQVEMLRALAPADHH